MIDDGDPKVIYGRLLEQVEAMAHDMHTLKGDVASLKGSMNKGWGIVIGAVAVLGMFASELITGVKRMIGIGG